jgi:NTE family protein
MGAGGGDALTAFVLGGGGQLGAAEVGMLRALLERGIRPDLIVGTSVGALNGVGIAAEPSLAAVDQLAATWTGLAKQKVFAGSFLGGASSLIRTRTHVHSNAPLRALVEQLVPVARFEDLKVPFQCVAACIERASEVWFAEGPIVDPILASCAVPGLLPPVEIAGEHYLDGGIVNSVPIERAVELGAKEIYVLHVGRIEQPLEAPRNPWEVAAVSFEIARRHRFVRDLASLPDGVVAHVLPTGDPDPPRFSDLSQLRYRDFSNVSLRIERAHDATIRYLEGV